MLVAQLVKQSLLTPEIHSSNPVIGKFYWKHDTKEKEAANGLMTNCYFLLGVEAEIISKNFTISAPGWLQRWGGLLSHPSIYLASHFPIWLAVFFHTIAVVGRVVLVISYTHSLSFWTIFLSLFLSIDLSITNSLNLSIFLSQSISNNLPISYNGSIHLSLTIYILHLLYLSIYLSISNTRSIYLAI